MPVPDRTRRRPFQTQAPRFGLARVMSKRGYCSRSRAEALVREGRVRVNGRLIRDPQWPVPDQARIVVDEADMERSEPVYIVLNKPRGVVVSAADERGRDTVYGLLEGGGLPWLGPVGRLDRASEGLLLLSNDTAWAARITDPASHLPKTYHVQVRGVPDGVLLEHMRAGVEDAGEHLTVVDVHLLRSGGRNAWLEIVLDEGRNRHIRRLLAALGFEVLRLIRVAVGPLVLGDLPKGEWRRLDEAEVRQLAEPGGAP